jgi:YnbE-like lipoprotein
MRCCAIGCMRNVVQPKLLPATRRVSLFTAVLLGLSGCITVKAPDKPIEINLNVKVQQEVIVRLQKDAQDLIQNNPELFPS